MNIYFNKAPDIYEYIRLGIDDMEVMIEREERISMPLSVVLDCTSGRREVRIADLSLGGCYVDSIAAVRPEEVVGIKLVLPHARSEEIFGTVVYVHDGIGFGVRFKELTNDQRTILQQLILLHGGKI